MALEAVGSAVYRASSLESTTLHDEEDVVDGAAETGVVDEEVDGLDQLTEGWDRESVLEHWSSVGAPEGPEGRHRRRTGRGARDPALFGDKDDVLGTQR